MKKIFILLMILLLCSSAYAQENMPSEPDFSYEKARKRVVTPAYNKQASGVKSQANPVLTVRPTGDATISRLNSLANSALIAAENHNSSEMQSYIMQMMQAGAEGFSSPEIISKRTPQCPPIKILVNGQTLSGSTCARMGYLYKGKQYNVGYCK